MASRALSAPYISGGRQSCCDHISCLSVSQTLPRWGQELSCPVFCVLNLIVALLFSLKKISKNC